MASHDSPTITLFYFPNSRADRIAWLLEELNLPYNAIGGERLTLSSPPDTNKEFKRQAGGTGQVPTLHDVIVNEKGEQEKLVLGETGAIAEYLLSQYPSDISTSLLPSAGPSTASQRAKILHFVHATEAGLMACFATVVATSYRIKSHPDSPLLKFLPGDENEAKRDEVASFAVKQFRGGLIGTMDWIEKELRTNNEKYGEPDKDDVFLVGDHFTVADIMIGWTIGLVLNRGVPELRDNPDGTKRWPWIEKFNITVKERDARKRALQRCGGT